MNLCAQLPSGSTKICGTYSIRSMRLMRFLAVFVVKAGIGVTTSSVTVAGDDLAGSTGTDDAAPESLLNVVRGGSDDARGGVRVGDGLVGDEADDVDAYPDAARSLISRSRRSLSALTRAAAAISSAVLGSPVPAVRAALDAALTLAGRGLL